MDTGADTLYSHDVAVAVIAKFYALIARLYGPNVGLEYPPAVGWPQLTSDLCDKFRMTPEAFDLVCHIPYFRHPPFIMFDCRPHRYVDDVFIPLSGVKEEDDGNEDEARGYPPHIFPLANNTSRNGCVLLIDVKHGVVIWYYIDGAPPMQGVPKPDAPCVFQQEDFEELYPDWRNVNDDDDDLDLLPWMEAPTYRIETFFALAKEQLLRMNWLPEFELESDYTMQELKVYGEPNDEQRDRMQIMIDAGWPGDEIWDWRRAVEETKEWAYIRYKMRSANREIYKAKNVAQIREGRKTVVHEKSGVNTEEKRG